MADKRTTTDPCLPIAGDKHSPTVQEPLMANSPVDDRAGGAGVEPAEGAGLQSWVPVTLWVDGTRRQLEVDPRTSLLDALRERLGVTSPKKGCDHGQCGACTVLLDGRRVNSCLVLAVAHDDAEVTTAAGLADHDDLHPLQRSFIEHDAFQCGYCTPGQIVSAAGMLREAEAGCPSVVTEDLTAETVELDDAEIRERMSGNLCRCGAYANIVPAIAQAARP
jgi:xanthine dehydrogenase YagT iron-sulfur-binding subunit